MDSIYSKLSHLEKEGIPSALCILIDSGGSTPRKSGTKMIVFSDGSIYGTIGGGKLEKLVIDEAITCIKTGQTGLFNYQLTQDAGMTCGGNTTVFVEPVLSKKRLYIFGAGHIGAFLAPIAHQLNFSVTLIDERPGIMDSIDISKINCISLPHEEAIATLTFDSNTFVCVTTYNHAHDKEIIGHIGKKNVAYLGMIGSKSKVALFSKELMEEGVLTQEDISKIDWPMGIPINCQTPQEIAISILAKLVDVRCPPKESSKK
ncbi:MAG: XdhC family protein [Salinivirgaceae bacterium]|nr:XdhC family protein [Salinivirgaceae bacterium]